MIDDVLKDFLDEAKARMLRSVEATKNEFATVRTGRASPHLLDRIEVDYYGARTPLRVLEELLDGGHQLSSVGIVVVLAGPEPPAGVEMSVPTRSPETMRSTLFSSAMLKT